MPLASDALRFLEPDIEYPYNAVLVLDKERSIRQYVAYMLDRTNRMFEYDGLPDTIPAYQLEMMLQTYGAVTICEATPIRPQYRLSTTKQGAEKGVYAFRPRWSSVPDIYLRPTAMIVANPVLSESMILEIGKDCEIIRNDTRCVGLLPMYFRYAEQLAENDISIRSAQINSRLKTIITVGTDREKESAEDYLKQLEAGELAVIAENTFLEGVKITNPGSAQPNGIIQLIELQQYLKASWFNEIGLNTNFNMKREYLSAEEIAANTDILLPLIDDMLYCREKACDRINTMFGLNISVRKNSSWENKARESEAEITNMESQADQKGGTDSDTKQSDNSSD